MRRILFVATGVLLCTAARADIHSPIVPLVALAGNANAVCYVSNISSYARSGKVAFYSQAGDKLAEMPYRLKAKETFELQYTTPVTPLGLGPGVRCSVAGDAPAGEAGIRASLCSAGLGGGLPPNLALTSTCLPAN